MQKKCHQKRNLFSWRIFFAYACTHLIFTEDWKQLYVKKRKFSLTDCSKNSKWLLWITLNYSKGFDWLVVTAVVNWLWSIKHFNFYTFQKSNHSFLAFLIEKLTDLNDQAQNFVCNIQPRAKVYIRLLNNVNGFSLREQNLF